TGSCSASRSVRSISSGSVASSSASRTPTAPFGSSSGRRPGCRRMPRGGTRCRRRSSAPAGWTTRSSRSARTSTRPGTSGGAGLTQAQLKYGLVDRFGRLLFCDPDFYPVARADEQSQADGRFAEIQSDAPTFTAIVAHLGIPASGTYSSAQRLAIYRDWKMLNALRLDPVGQGFHFLAIFSGNPAGTGNQGTRVDGTIDQRGTISVASQTPSGPPPCPICLARGTRVATPTGDAAVEDLRVGDLVWTEGVSGARIAAPLVSTC